MSTDEKTPEKKPESTALAAQPVGPPIAMSLDTVQGFEALQRAARLFASSNLVPDGYKNNIPNCTIALAIAMRMKVDPFMVFQNLNIIKGKPGWSSAFLIAAVNQSGRFTPLRFRFTGERTADTYGCVVSAKDLKSGETLDGTEVTLRMAVAEGWGMKWKTMPEQMLRYRAAAFWIRAYAPEVTMGFQTQDEVEDVYEARNTPPQEVVVSPPVQTPEDRLLEEAKKLGITPEVATAPFAAPPEPTKVPVEAEKPTRHPQPRQAKEAIKDRLDAIRAQHGTAGGAPGTEKPAAQPDLPLPPVNREPGEEG